VDGTGASPDVPIGHRLPGISRHIGTDQLRSRSFSGYNPIHWDEDYARARGFTGPIATGQLLTAYMQEMIVEFLGIHAFSNTTFTCRYRAPAQLDDTITTGGVVTDRVVERDGTRVTIDVWCSNQNSVQIVSGVVRSVVRRMP
jgi:acyl dehydratase